MAINTTTQQQEVESVEHKEEKILELIYHDTGANGEINTEHYIQYHDELEKPFRKKMKKNHQLQRKMTLMKQTQYRMPQKNLMMNSLIWPSMTLLKT